MKKYEIELEDGVRIFGLIQCGYGFYSDGKYRLKGDLMDIINTIKSNNREALIHNRFEIDFSNSGNFGYNTISIPFDVIWYIRDEKDNVLYSKY